MTSIMPTPPALDYLRPSPDDPWRWDDGGEVLRMREGATVAFKAEIVAVLERLTPGGLPPFSLVVLVLAATRDGFPDLLPEETRRLLAEDGAGERNLLAAFSRVRSLPEDRRRTVEAKAGLLEAIFPPRGPRAPHREPGRLPIGRETVAQLRAGLPLEALEPWSPEPGPPALEQTRPAEAAPPGWLLETLRYRRKDRRGPSEWPRVAIASATVERLVDGLLALDARALSLREGTGLDRLPRPAELPPERESDHVRALLTRLLDHRVHARMAALSRDLLAAIHLPREAAAQDDLAIGGVTDLSNRGPLERLLHQELAHDDLVLAVRIAEREALYLRRESPPRRPPGTRLLLLDAGIRLLGKARIFAAATALALAAHGDPRRRVLAFRAEGAQLADVDLASEAGLEAHLAALHPASHPGPALAPLLERAQGLPGPLEAILVTHARTLGDEEFALALAPLRDRLRLRAATVDESGRFALATLTPAGRVPLAEARLDLERLLRPPTPAPEETGLVICARGGRPGPDGLPLAHRLERYPLLLPCPIEGLRACCEPGRGVLVSAEDGWIYLRREKELLGRPLARRPRGRLVAITAEGPRGAALFVHGRDATLVAIDLAGELARPIPLGSLESDPLHAFLDADALVVVARRRVEAFDLETGEVVSRMELPRSWPSLDAPTGRYVQHGRSWHRIYRAGHEMRLARLPLADEAGEDWVVAPFDQLAHEGAFLLTTAGIRDPRGTRIPFRDRPRPGLRLAAVSRSGERLLVSHGGIDERIDVRTMRGDRVAPAAPAFACLEPDAMPDGPQGAAVRRRIRAVAAAEAGRLVVSVEASASERARTGSPERLLLVDQPDSPSAPLRVRPVPPRLPLRVLPVRFVPARDLTAPLGRGWRRALFPSGEEALLDPRGVLHLRTRGRPRGGVPSDEEVALVLSETGVRGHAGSPAVPAPPEGQAALAQALRRFVDGLR